MKDINTYIKEGFFSNVGADSYFAKYVCDNTYKYDKFVEGDKIHMPRSDGQPYPSKTYKIEVDGPWSLRIYNIKGLAVKNRDIILDFTPHKSEIEKTMANPWWHGDIEDLRLQIYPKPSVTNDRVEIEVNLMNKSYQIISYSYDFNKNKLY